MHLALALILNILTGMLYFYAQVDTYYRLPVAIGISLLAGMLLFVTGYRSGQDRYPRGIPCLGIDTHVG